VRRYLLRTLSVAAVYLTAHFLICLYVPAPIAAEYWLRELIVVQHNLANSISSPRIIFLGGSNLLFGIDAREVEEATGIHALNMGMHGGLRLERVLSAGQDVARPGDIFVLTLEPDFFSCHNKPWSDWQVENALAWDRSYFEGLSLPTRIGAIYFGGSAMLSLELLITRLGSMIKPGDYADRLSAKAPAEVIWQRYQSGKLKSDFPYSAYNLDDRGDVQRYIGTYKGAALPANQPSNICPYALSILARFVTRMKHDGVRVLIGHTPYIVEGLPVAGWQEAEAKFLHDVDSAGATIFDRREELFLPRHYFFDTEYHLNDIGRRERTKTMIANLRNLGIGTGRDRGIVGRAP
jgi:hypothetical protein